MNVIYLLFVAAMLVPFQAIMYPLISIMESLSLKNLLGLIIMYTGFGISMSVFMMTGYIKGKGFPNTDKWIHNRLKRN